MKKIFVLLFGLLAAGQVFAQASQNPCNNGAQADFTATTAGLFVTRGFPVRCSSNVFVNTEQNTIALVVGGASGKGNNSFRASTNGGAITGSPCANANVCINTDASSGLAALLSSAT